MGWIHEMSTAGLFALREVLTGGDPKLIRRFLKETHRELRKRHGGVVAEARESLVADWLYAAERVYAGPPQAPAGKGAKAKPRQRKAARRELVSC
jgi:hypothetical protein